MNALTAAAPHATRPAPAWRPVAWLALFTLATRAPALLIPRPIDDELVYAVVGRVLLDGGRPYVDAIERKPPLLFWLYRGIFAVAGSSNWAALHIVMVIWTFVTMILLYMTARRLWTPAAGWWAAGLYSVYAIWGDYRMLALNGELLMNLPIVAAFAVAFGAADGASRLRYSVAGALTAVGFLLKQPAGAAIVPLIWYALSDRSRHPLRLVRWGDMIAVVAGFTAVTLVAVLVLRREGVLREAIYWTLLDHEVPPAIWLRMTIRNGPLRIARFLISALPLVIGAWVSMRAGWRGKACWQGRRREFSALCAFLVVSVVGVVSNAQYLLHYFLQLLPPLTLIAAPVFAAAFDARSSDACRPPFGRRTITWWLAITAAGFCIVNTITIAQHWKTSAAAEFVRAHSNAADRLFVWGQSDDATGMYVEADRPPATRYISIYPLTGLLFGSRRDEVDETARVRPDEWERFDRDIAAHPPRFVIDADAASGSKYPVARYPHLTRHLAGCARVWSGPDGVVWQCSTVGQ